MPDDDVREPFPNEFVPADYFRRLRPDEIFQIGSPFEVDLGCGDGTFLAAMAEHFPDRRFLGVERLLGRVRKACRKVAGLGNARVLRLESTYALAWLLPGRAVSRLHLLCPDPWPKKRHAPRRLVNDPEFLDALARALVPGGEFLLKTDHPPYHGDALESLGARPEFAREPWPEDAFFYPQTDFEKQWLAEGRPIHRARWCRAGC